MLDLSENKIDEEGAQYWAEELQKNMVTNIFFSFTHSVFSMIFL
jgi:hypothetical protein